MNNNQTAVFAITLSGNNSTWLVYSDDEESAKVAVTGSMSAVSAIANPDSTSSGYDP